MTSGLFRDLWLKAASVCLAFLLWVSVTGEPVVERGLDIPLEFENVPVGSQISGDPPDVIGVRVRGSSSSIEGDAVRAHVDLAGLSPGRYNLPVTVESSDDGRITQIDPPSIQVNLR